MKKLGPDTTKHLRLLVEGPPTAEDMQGLLRALAWDGDAERAAKLAEVMVEHHQHVDRGGHVFASEIDRDHERNRFYYWLGIRSAMSCIASGRELRRIHTRGNARRAA